MKKRYLLLISLLVLTLSISVGARMSVLVVGGGTGSVPSFVFTITTLVEDDSFALPIYNGGTYNFNVDWGDSSNSDITTWDDADNPHTYADAGASTYTITITGTITGFRFNNAGDKTLIQEVQSWGPVNLGNSNGYFYGASNLTVTATDTLDLTNTTTFEGIFRACTSLSTVPSMNSWDISSVTKMIRAFSDASSFNQNIGSWNVAAVTRMDNMFYGNTAFDQNIGSWVVSSVTQMNSMFEAAAAFNQDIGSWTVTSVTNMNKMFRSATLFNQDISGWNVGAVTNMAEMLRETAFSQDISGWDTGAVTDMSVMFYSTTSFDQNLGGWDITQVTSMLNMFTNVTLSTANYSAILIGWEGQVEKPNVTFHGGNSLYSAGAATTARAALVTNGWTITDGGQEP